MKPMVTERKFNPEMLVLAREARSLNQTELAGLAGVTQGQISKIENGQREPPPELISTFARVLKYRESLFFRNEVIAGIPESYTRKRQSLSATALHRIIAELNLRRFAIIRLLKAAEIQERLPFPELDLEDYGSPAEVARAVRSAWLLPPGPVRNLMRCIEAAGGILVPCDFGVGELDAIGQRIPGAPPLIFYNTRFPGDRLRFTLAHEVAHLIMHRVPHPDMEKEANQFAAELLVPERDVRPQLTGNLRLSDLAALKPYWRVSMAMLLERAKDVGRISSGRYVQLRKEYTGRGYKYGEPPELAVEPEVPANLRDLIALHLGHLGYSPEELSEVADLYAEEFHQSYVPERPHLRLIAS